RPDDGRHRTHPQGSGVVRRNKGLRPDRRRLAGRHLGGDPAMEPAAVSPGWRTSSYSGNGGDTCVEVGAVPWRTSSYSDNGGDSCVEVGALPQNTASTVLIRDTTLRGG